MDDDAYWHLEVQSVDWVPVLARLINSKPDNDDTDAVITGNDEVILYSLKRESYPAALLAERLGTKVRLIEEAPRLILKPFRAVATWEKPTVTYWGLA